MGAHASRPMISFSKVRMHIGQRQLKQHQHHLEVSTHRKRVIYLFIYT